MFTFFLSTDLMVYVMVGGLASFWGPMLALGGLFFFVIPTILLLVGISLLGAVLLAHQGIGTWRRLRETIRRRESPTDDLVDAALNLSPLQAA